MGPERPPPSGVGGQKRTLHAHLAWRVLPLMSAGQGMTAASSAGTVPRSGCPDNSDRSCSTSGRSDRCTYAIRLVTSCQIARLIIHLSELSDVFCPSDGTFIASFLAHITKSFYLCAGLDTIEVDKCGRYTSCIARIFFCPSTGLLLPVRLSV